MYSITFSDLATKNLNKLNKDTQKRILATIERCRIRPYAHVKRIIGAPYFRLRVGDYRVIMKILNNELLILVINIKHRKNIYKKKPR